MRPRSAEVLSQAIRDEEIDFDEGLVEHLGRFGQLDLTTFLAAKLAIGYSALGRLDEIFDLPDGRANVAEIIDRYELRPFLNSEEHAMTIQEAAKFAVETVLESFKESGLYDDYQQHEGFADEQYDEMLQTLQFLAANGVYRLAVIESACDIQEQSEEGADREAALDMVVEGFRSHIREMLPPHA